MVGKRSARCSPTPRQSRKTDALPLRAISSQIDRATMSREASSPRGSASRRKRRPSASTTNPPSPRTAFRPIKLRVGMSVVHLVHHLRRSDISVKCDRVAVFAHAPFIEFADRPSPQVVVMVEYPDLRGEATLLKRGAKVVLDESNLVFLRPGARGHTAILVGIDFILYRHCQNGHAFRGIGLQELHKILRVGTEVVLPHGTAQHRAAGLHPSRRAPWRRK